MKIGASETVPLDPSVRRGPRRLAIPGAPSDSGKGDGGYPDGGDLPRFSAADEPETPFIDKSKFIAWFLLLAVGMTFAGLLGAYLMIATNRAAEWKPFALPVQVWISTLLILLSSVTYARSKRSIDKDNYLGARNWLVATTVLGATFVSSQFIVWLELTSRGFYMQGNPYAGFFYILTAAHLVHVAGGIVALGAILLKSWRPSVNEADRTRRKDLARSVGWYWHFMGGLWVILFLMLGFWK